MGEVTMLIERARGGSREAFDRIFELLYPELRQIAHRRLSRGARDGRMETTALVNECYLKFIQRESLTPGDRSHFLAYSADRDALDHRRRGTSWRTPTAAAATHSTSR